jgi:D-3-phosphoglycerate dehydrogenase
MIRDNMSPLAKEIMEETGKIEVVIDNDKATNNPEELKKIIKDFHGLGVRSGTKVTAEVLEAAKNLKVIGRAGIGVDNIDVTEATARGVVVMNAPGGNTVTTAEHAVSMLLSLARNVPQATASLREGKWEKKKFLGVEIRGKTLGVMGLGQIGRVVADRALGLRMKVIAHDPFVTEEAAKELGVESVSMDELFARADFITMHVPGLPETRDLVRGENIEKMKDGVRIINCSRGNVVNLDDLYQALESGKVGGAALDVYPKEPPDPSLSILQHPNVILTPHLGAATGEAQEKVAEMIARQMTDYLISGVITNAVNFPSVSREAMDRLRPYLDLAERMGSLMGQLIRRLHDITVTYSGEVAELDTRPLTLAVLKGLLGSYTDQPVNYVSAPAIAKEKGIKVEETISRDSKDYTTLIRVKLEGPEEKLNDVWGTIFGKKNPRIVRLGRIYMDAIPEGSVLVIQNHDKPGVIGNLGTTLARHNINIGRFQLGRRDGQALCMVNIDEPADDKVVEEIRSLPNIISVKQVKLD